MNTLRTITLLLALSPSLAGAQELFTDGARSTLAEAIDTTETGIDVTTGSLFPQPTGGGGASDFFLATMVRVSDATVFEVVRCTARSTNTLTCARDCTTGTCDNTGTTFSSGDYIYLSVNRSTLERTNGAGNVRDITYHSPTTRLPAGAAAAYVDQGALTIRETTATPTISATGAKVIYSDGLVSCPNMPPRLWSLSNATGSTPQAFLYNILGDRRTSIWGSAGTTTGITTYGNAGVPALTSISYSSVSPADTNDRSRRPRYRAATAASSGVLGIIQSPPALFRSAVSGKGGFFVAHMAVGWNAMAAGGGFYGVGSTLASGTFSDCVDCVGFAHEVGQSNLHFYHNDGTGVVTDTDLGASFPVNTTTSWYDFYIYTGPNPASTIEVCVVDKADGDIWTASASSNLPTNTVGLRVQLNVYTGVTASSVGVESVGSFFTLGQ